MLDVGCAIPGVRWVAVSSPRPPGLRNLAGTDHQARTLEHLQNLLLQGPSIDALTDGRPVHCAELRRDDRWPEFSPRVSRFGVTALVAASSGRAIGSPVSVTCYAIRPHRFDERAARAVEALALLAAGALAADAPAADGSAERLRTALQSRDVIGQAKGMLMQTFAIDADEAFALLVQLSQRTNRKLRDVAGELARTGRIPADLRPAPPSNG